MAWMPATTTEPMMMNSRVRKSAVSLAVLLLSIFVANGETVITSVPFTITAPGTYVLNSDLVLPLSVSGAAIIIRASNVVLDLKGHVLAQAPGGAKAIYAQDRSDITIRNGTIDGFVQPVYLVGTTDDPRHNGGIVIEKLRLISATRSGIYLAKAKGCRIEDCQIGPVRKSSDGMCNGILISGGSGVIRRNFITMTAPGAASQIGVAIASDSPTNSNLAVIGNLIENARVGISANYSLSTPSNVRAQDNLTANVTNPGIERVDAGGNN